MDNNKPTQLDWDKHLIRCWYANKFATMNELEKWFYYCWGVWPKEVATERRSGIGISVWKFVESMPNLNKALNKYGKDRAEEIAVKLQSVKCSPNPLVKKERKGYSGFAKDKARLVFERSASASIKKLNRGEQWGVCK